MSEKQKRSSMMITLLSYAFCILLAVGAFMGYRKKGSIASLVAGGGSALVLFSLEMFGNGALSSDNVNGAHAAFVVQFVTTIALAFGMGFRSYDRLENRWKFFPAGLVAILSTIMVLFYYTRLTSLPSIKKTA